MGQLHENNMGNCSGNFSIQDGLYDYNSPSAEFEDRCRAKGPEERPWQSFYEAELEDRRAHPQQMPSSPVHKLQAQKHIRKVAAEKTERLTKQLHNLFSSFDEDCDGILNQKELECMVNARGAIGRRVIAPMAEMALAQSWDAHAELLVAHLAEPLKCDCTTKQLAQTLTPDFEARDCFMIRYIRDATVAQFQQMQGPGKRRDAYCNELRQALDPAGQGITVDKFVAGMLAFDLQKWANAAPGQAGVKLTSSQRNEATEEIRVNSKSKNSKFIESVKLDHCSCDAHAARAQGEGWRQYVASGTVDTVVSVAA